MSRKPRNNFRIMIFGVAAGLLTFISISTFAEPLRFAIGRIAITPLLRWGAKLSQGISLRGGDTGDMNTADPIKVLQAENELLQKENTTLREALKLGEEQKKLLIPVHNIGFSRNFGNEIVIIDRGRESDIAIGDTVMTGDKIYVGRVITVEDREANVLLVTSLASTLSVSFIGSDIQARGRGMNGRELVVDLIPENASVEKGDFVVVAPLSGETASGLLVGEIRDVGVGETKVFKNIRVFHFFDPTKIIPLFVMNNSKR